MIYKYDIEAYYNFFCAGFIDDNEHCDMFYIVNTEEDAQKVNEGCERAVTNKMIKSYKLLDLNQPQHVRKLKHYMRHQKPTTQKKSLLSDFLNIEDKPIEEKKEVLLAFNSLNYDIPMLDYVLGSAIGNRIQASTQAIREYSNSIIENKIKVSASNAHKLYGNQIDVAFLNVKMIHKGRIKEGLKTQVGKTGGRIEESEDTKTGYAKDIAYEVYYCINDIVEMDKRYYKQGLEPIYTVRKTLLEKFPYIKDLGISINNTPSQFARAILAPDKPIVDDPLVSFMYPGEVMAKEANIERFDLLEYMRKWYVKNVYNIVKKHNKQKARRHYAKFMSIYNYYASIRNKNWNTGQRHLNIYNNKAYDKTDRKKLLDTFGTYLSLIDKYGNETGGYVNFSIGGIHGAEFNLEQLNKDKKVIRYLRKKYGYFSKIPDKELKRVETQLLNLIKEQSRTAVNSYPVQFSHEIPEFYKKSKKIDKILHEDDFTPFIYKEKGDTGQRETLIKRYVYISIGLSNHQDFVQYYPTIMNNLEIFLDKDTGQNLLLDFMKTRAKIKEEMKRHKKGSATWIKLNIEQDAYKLIANSVSGVLDEEYDHNLRANNKAITMRCCGQFITYISTQALSLEGARTPSTNTDGFYTFNIDLELNKTIVDKELAPLFIKIDPEECFFISKDTNNRMEIVNGKVESAKGGTLSASTGPSIFSSLPHPSISDNILVDYLQLPDISQKDIDLEMIRKIFIKKKDELSKLEFLKWTAWVMRPTSDSIFVDNQNNVHKGAIRTWLTKSGLKIQKFVHKKSKPTKTLDEYAEYLFEDSLLGEPEVINYLTEVNAITHFNELASTVTQYSEIKGDIPVSKYKTCDSVRYVANQKISKLPESTYVTINNEAIDELTTDVIDAIYNNLDIDAYVDLISQNAIVWHNKTYPSIKNYEEMLEELKIL